MSFGANIHRHPMLEVYAACDGDGHMLVNGDMVSGPVLMVAPNADHAIADSGKPGLALFLDPLLPRGYALGAGHLKGSPWAAFDGLIPDNRFAQLAQDPTEEAIRRASESLLGALDDPSARPPLAQPLFVEPVSEVIEALQEDDATYNMDDLAARVCLSKSRLAHAFSEQTGITLKDYIQLKRLGKACRTMVQGKSITQAAVDVGFASSSHIASSSMRLTGMQLRRMLGL